MLSQHSSERMSFWTLRAGRHEHAMIGVIDEGPRQRAVRDRYAEDEQQKLTEAQSHREAGSTVR